jgi:hypothetical protein
MVPFYDATGLQFLHHCNETLAANFKDYLRRNAVNTVLIHRIPLRHPKSSLTG